MNIDIIKSFEQKRIETFIRLLSFQKEILSKIAKPFWIILSATDFKVKESFFLVALSDFQNWFHDEKFREILLALIKHSLMSAFDKSTSFKEESLFISWLFKLWCFILSSKFPWSSSSKIYSFIEKEMKIEEWDLAIKNAAFEEELKENVWYWAIFLLSSVKILRFLKLTMILVRSFQNFFT